MLLGQAKNQLYMYTIYSFVPRVSAKVVVGLMMINVLNSRKQVLTYIHNLMLSAASCMYHSYREPSKMQVALIQRCCKQIAADGIQTYIAVK